MVTNVGNVDRFIRIVAGLIILSLVFVGPKTSWGYLGLILIATAVIRWCPAYLPFGFSSRKDNSA